MSKYAIPVLSKARTRLEVIYDYVAACSGCTSRDISADLDLADHRVRQKLLLLKQLGILVNRGVDHTKRRMWFVKNKRLIFREVIA